MSKLNKPGEGFAASPTGNNSSQARFCP